MRGNIHKLVQIFADALCVSGLTVFLVLSASGEVCSQNIVGYCNVEARKGTCKIPVVRNPGEAEAKYSSLVSQLDEGDKILASGPEEKTQRFARIEVGDDGKKHAVLDGMIVDDFVLPNQTVATVVRVSEKPSPVTVAGEFELPTYDFDSRNVDATLDQIRLPKRIIQKLQTGTGPLQFTLLKKDGTSQPAVVSPVTRKYTDPGTNEAIKDPLDILKGIKPLETSSQQEKETVCALAKETDSSIRDLAANQIREVLAMAAFDTNHWFISLSVWLGALGVLALVNKLWDAFWTWLGSLVKRRFRRSRGSKCEKMSRRRRHRH